MSLIKASIVLGVVLLATGFAVGTQPTDHRGRQCGSVLFPVDPLEAGGGPSSVTSCEETHSGLRWAGTWLPLGLGGLAVLVGWTGFTERERAGEPGPAHDQGRAAPGQP